MVSTVRQRIGNTRINSKAKPDHDHKYFIMTGLYQTTTKIMN